MWKCPNCGEQIDGVFDTCWKCGLAQDGSAATDFQAEPSDLATLDPKTKPEPRDENSTNFITASADGKNERIVEFCSAANAVEAYIIRALLEEAGIQARVVGDLLGNAAGMLPLGETLAPRIWVRECDAAYAREIIESQPGQECSDCVEGDQPSEKEEDVFSSTIAWFGWLSQVFMIAAAFCILLGTIWAWCSWMTMQKYQGTAEGVLVACNPHFSSYIPPPPENPLPREPPNFSFQYDVQYEYTVAGTTYYAKIYNSSKAYRCITIHYDPSYPEKNIVGPLTSPWIVIVSALTMGIFLVSLGSCFHKQTSRGRECDKLSHLN
jgi:hypothetical protein